MEPPTLEAVQAWDQADALRPTREAFELPAGIIYLDGNSLGPLPRATSANQDRLLREQWGHDLIASWQKHDWLAAPARIGDKIAKLIGARPGEVIVADSTSVNLFKLLTAAVQARPDRHVILMEAADFPTDRYIAEGVRALLPSLTLRATSARDLQAAVDRDVAVVLLAHVHYRTGTAHDIAALTTAAHAAGALTLWDLSHSAGAIPIELSAADADLAVGCGYKFLNGGPGAPAFLYVNTRLHDQLNSPLPGWMGHADPFAFSDRYRPAPGVARFLCGTPPMLALAALETGIDLSLAVDRQAIAAKAARLFDLFATRMAPHHKGGLQLLTPEAANRRGSQISFRHPAARGIMRRLAARGVIGDFRPPDVLRFGLTPLYSSYLDIWRATEATAAAIDAELADLQTWDAEG